MGISGAVRKQDHIRITLGEDVAAKGVTTGLDDYRFVHQALPEIDLHDVDTSVSMFRKKLTAPLVISPMVGGVEEAREINLNLARAAQKIGVAMGVGSQRCALEDTAAAKTYSVRDVAPDILLFANLGAIQLNQGLGVEDCRRIVDMIGADVLVLHLNPLQEALQSGGNTNFGGLLKQIGRVCHSLRVPVVVKEVGCGISEQAARQLISAGVSGIDVAGAGGTSWSEVERCRADTDYQRRVAGAFAAWGIPTADSIQMARRSAGKLPVIASGGIRGGVDVAKALALGADAAGIAAPLLKAATSSIDDVAVILEEVAEELRIAMFCVGAANVARLKNTRCLVRKT